MTVHLAPSLGAARELYCPACELSYPDGAECPKDGTRLVNVIAPIDSLVGRDIDGRFTILEQLGQGGMGAVYRANQHSVGREVAIKFVHANLASDAAVIKRFLREARLASRLSHPNAVGVLDFGQTVDGLFYLVMELVSGRTLATVFEEDGVFDARRVIKVGMQVCEALEAAHQLAIIHRDLKPANIMMLDTGRDLVKVLDFGLAKSLVNEQASEMTGSNGLIGTPAFMPPERALGGSGDARSDLYSLGCILYLLGSGIAPFASEDLQDLLMKQVVSAAPPMVNVPAALAAVIDRLLLKSPDLRYQTAAEAREALEDALGELPPAARRRSTQPSVPVPSVSLFDAAPDEDVPPRPSTPIEVERMVREDTQLAATPPPLPRTWPRWPWVVAVSAIAIALVVSAFGTSDAPAHAVDAPIVVIPLPTAVVSPARLPATAVEAEPVVARSGSAVSAPRPRPVKPAAPPRKPQGPQFPF